MGFLALPLALPQASQARGGTEFPGFRLLGASDVEGVLETGFGFSMII
jgi:hypothetical protein